MKRQVLTPKSVLTISDKLDAHLPFVERHLSVPLIRVDVAAIMTGEELSYAFIKGELRITHKDRLLDNIAGVWLRGARGQKDLLIPTPPFYQEYARNAITRHTEALYSQLSGTRWVSNYYAIRRAEYKPLQIQLALRLGFKVPDTLFTSCPARAKEFIDNYPATIMKPIGVIWPKNKEKNLIFVFYATKIYKGEAIDLSGLSMAPAIFQRAVDAAADLRVTVIGKKVFSAIIVDKKLDRKSRTRDWRIGGVTGELYVEPYTLPRNIADKCLALVKELGLEFGAIDLVLDKKGEIWFLENNANGQWGFIEEETGLPLGKAMADLLQDKV